MSFSEDCCRECGQGCGHEEIPNGGGVYRCCRCYYDERAMCDIDSKYSKTADCEYKHQEDYWI